MLTPKQKLFVTEYLKDGNGQRAAVAAGYPERTARIVAAQNLQKPHIQEYIRTVQADLVVLSQSEAADLIASHVEDTTKTAVLLTEQTRREAVLADARARGREQSEVLIPAMRVIEELATLGLATLEHFEIDDTGHVRPRPNAPPNAMQAVASIDRTVRHTREGPVYNTKIKLWDKNAALNMLSKHHDLFAPAKHELTGKDGGPVEMQVDHRAELMNEIDAMLERAPAVVVQEPAALGPGTIVEQETEREPKG